MQEHTHKVPIKSADAILDEFLLNHALKDNTLKRSVSQLLNKHQAQETNTKLKNGSPTAITTSKTLPSPTETLTGKRNQNLLFAIGGHHHNHNISNNNNNSWSDSCDDNFRSDHNNVESNLSASSSAAVQIVHVSPKLIFFLFIVITLNLTYAVHSYYQQSQQYKRQQQQQPQLVVESASQQQLPGAITPASSLVSTSADLPPAEQQDIMSDSMLSAASNKLQMQDTTFQTKMEGKIHLLERYIEMLAIDLEETKNRLRERERCACSIGCSFNGTRYSDGQRWQQKCDVCTCHAGKISCLPRECPKLANCDDPVQLPGQCCPTCMKQCKINNGFVRHGRIFQPNSTNGEPVTNKLCKCHDGLIKCERIEPPVNANKKHMKSRPLPAQAAKNRTLEYLKTILGPRNAHVQETLLLNAPHQTETTTTTNSYIRLR